MQNNSPVVKAALFATEMLIRNVLWEFKPSDDSAEADMYAEKMRGMLFDDLPMSWSLLISEILSFVPFGFSLFELVLKRRLGLNPPPMPDGSPALPSKFNDGAVGLGKIAPRSQDTLLRWELGWSGDILGAHMLDPWAGRAAYIPMEKALLFRPSSWKDNPEGRSVLRNAYRPWYMVSHIENVESVASERDLTGIPLIGTPGQWWLPGAAPEEVGQLEMAKRVGRNVRQDEQACVVYPLIYDAAGNQLFKFELMSSPGQKSINTDTVIQRYELRIAQSMLADMIFLGHEDVGSFALASSKTTTQAMSLGGYLTVIKDEFNRRALPLIWRLNAWPEKKMPCLDHGDVETVDLTELARFMLSFGRIFPMKDVENHIRVAAGWPIRPEAGKASDHPEPAIAPKAPGGGFSHGGGSGLSTEGSTSLEGGPGMGLESDLDRQLSSPSL